MKRNLLRSDRGEKYGAGVDVFAMRICCFFLGQNIIYFDAVARGVALRSDTKCGGRV